MTQHNDLMSRVARREKDAINEWIQLQRQGKHIRFYPEGRKGPTDEGLAPITIGQAPSKLIRFSFGREPIFQMQPEMIGEFTFAIMSHTHRMLKHFRSISDKWADVCEPLATPGLKFQSVISENLDSITTMFEPIEERDFDFGVYHARRLVAQWINLILVNHPLESEYTIEPKWGISEEQLPDVLMFMPDPELED